MKKRVAIFLTIAIPAWLVGIAVWSAPYIWLLHIMGIEHNTSATLLLMMWGWIYGIGSMLLLRMAWEKWVDRW